jgi:outer membrane immunogenic protein
MTWVGIYGGVNIGYAFGADSSARDGGFLLNGPHRNGAGWVLNNDINGVVGGGQIGSNWQYAPWLVLGVEADIQASDARSNQAGVFPGFVSGLFGPSVVGVNSNKIVDWFGTVRGRIGVPMFNQRLLAYATGGFAYGAVDHNINVTHLYPAVGVFG